MNKPTAWVDWYRIAYITPHIQWEDKYPSTIAERDHVIQQMNNRALYWPGVHKVKMRKVQHRLCYGIAYDAQQNNVFSVQPRPTRSGSNSNIGEIGSTAEPEPG